MKKLWAIYKKHEEIPSMGFSPDSDFPCIYAEKAVLSLLLSDKITNIIVNSKNRFINDISPITIEDIDCKQNAINVVPKFCSCIINIKNSKIIYSILTSIKN